MGTTYTDTFISALFFLLSKTRSLDQHQPVEVPSGLLSVWEKWGLSPTWEHILLWQTNTDWSIKPAGITWACSTCHSKLNISQKMPGIHICKCLCLWFLTLAKLPFSFCSFACFYNHGQAKVGVLPCSQHSFITKEDNDIAELPKITFRNAHRILPFFFFFKPLAKAFGICLHLFISACVWAFFS